MPSCFPEFKPVQISSLLVAFQMDCWELLSISQLSKITKKNWIMGISEENLTLTFNCKNNCKNKMVPKSWTNLCILPAAYNSRTSTSDILTEKNIFSRDYRSLSNLEKESPLSDNQEQEKLQSLISSSAYTHRNKDRSWSIRSALLIIEKKEKDLISLLSHKNPLCSIEP